MEKSSPVQVKRSTDLKLKPLVHGVFAENLVSESVTVPETIAATGEVSTENVITQSEAAGNNPITTNGNGNVFENRQSEKYQEREVDFMGTAALSVSNGFLPVVTEKREGLANFQFNKTGAFNSDGRMKQPDPQQKEMGLQGFVNSTMAYEPANAAKVINRRSKWSVQLYATPSISYRYLLENKTYVENPAAANGPLAPYLTNPASDFINQKPKLGLEAGTAFLYDLAKNFRVKTGFQVNYRQFGLQAFATNAQPAMLALNGQNGLDSIIRFSSISTQSGYKAIELSSNFLQIAIPVGFDMKIADSRTIDFYVSAAGQFTYQLASSNYLLSSDYKNYLKQPDLERKFNINTAVEAFASFEAGGITWQAGPQIRYQLLPGSKSAYPIREHLIDYGFKIGVVKKLK
jgi:hypothetical protein